MKPIRAFGLAAGIAAGIAVLHAAWAQSGVQRTDLQREDISAPGREAIQVLVELAPGAAFPKHSHPGEELVYVVSGSQAASHTVQIRKALT